MSNIQVFNFEGYDLPVFAYRGKPCWIAKDVGRVLGYAGDGGKMTTRLSCEWGDEFIGGEDFFILEGDELRDFKTLLSHTPEYGVSGLDRIARIMMLTESGLHLVCVKSNKPVGKKLRRWLVDEVLPSLTKTGTYSIAASGVQSLTVKERVALLDSESRRDVARAKVINAEARMENAKARHGQVAVSRMRAEAMLKNAETKAAKLAWQKSGVKASAVVALAHDRLEDGLITEEQFGKYKEYAYQEGMGGPDRTVFADNDGTEWMKLSVFAKRIKVSEQKIGRLRKELFGEGEVDGLVKIKVGRPRYHDMGVVNVVYLSKRAMGILSDRLQGQRDLFGNGVEN